MSRTINKKNMCITFSVTAIGICIGVYDRLMNDIKPIETVLYWLLQKNAPVESSQEIITMSSTMSGFGLLSILLIAIVGIIIVTSTMCYSSRM